MPRYLVRKRLGWPKRIRVTVQEDNGTERWRASFRYIWDANTFINALCRNPLYVAVDSDYYKPTGEELP